MVAFGLFGREKTRRIYVEPVARRTQHTCTCSMGRYHNRRWRSIIHVTMAASEAATDLVATRKITKYDHLMDNHHFAPLLSRSWALLITGMLILVLVLKDSLRTYFKSLSLSLGVRSLPLSWSLWVRSLSLSWSLWSSPCPCF